jgi:hypothetical protein
MIPFIHHLGSLDLRIGDQHTLTSFFTARCTSEFLS